MSISCTCIQYNICVSILVMTLMSIPCILAYCKMYHKVRIYYLCVPISINHQYYENNCVFFITIDYRYINIHKGVHASTREFSQLKPADIN